MCRIFCYILCAIYWVSAAARAIALLTHEKLTARALLTHEKLTARKIQLRPCLLFPPFLSSVLICHHRFDLPPDRCRPAAPKPPHACPVHAVAVKPTRQCHHRRDCERRASVRLIWCCVLVDLAACCAGGCGALTDGNHVLLEPRRNLAHPRCSTKSSQSICRH
jgi:hypothetical protein